MPIGLETKKTRRLNEKGRIKKDLVLLDCFLAICHSSGRGTPLRPALSWQYGMATEFCRGRHCRLQLLVRNN